MCNHNCNQGRTCTCSKAEPEGIKTWHIVLAVVLFWWGYVELFTK